MSAETKACDNQFCEKTLSAQSEFTLCSRCRNYDKRASKKNPRWARQRHATLCRWDNLLVNAAPKNTWKNPDPLDWTVEKRKG